MLDQFRSLLNHFHQRCSFDSFSMRLHITIAISVEQPETERIDSEFVRDDIHLRLDREIPQGDTKSAHRAGRLPVGVHAVSVYPNIWNCVRAWHMSCRLGGPIRTVSGVSSSVNVKRDLSGNYSAITHDTVFDIKSFAARVDEIRISSSRV